MSEYREILLRYNAEDQTFEEYEEPYATIDCPTEADYNRFNELVEFGNRMQWHPADVEWPTNEMLMDNGEFIVMISGAANPTTLLYDRDYGIWTDDEGNVFSVDWWMPLPKAPKKEKEHVQIY